MSSLPPSLQRADLNQRLIDIGLEAGQAILEIYYQQGEIEINHKGDDSPVTQADLAAHKVICAALAEFSPEIPVLSEESPMPSFAERQSWQYYWLIDPLDGTKEFINRNDEFTVNIALIHENKPIFGLVHSPVLKLSYIGNLLADRSEAIKYSNDGSTITKQEAISTQAQALQQELIVVGSRRHGAAEIDALIGQLENSFSQCHLESMGSSLKLCLIAEGKAQLYPRLAPTCEWDTAAAHAVVSAAGGKVLNPEFSDLRYNHKESLLNPNFYVVGDPSLDWAELLDPSS
ncbi:MAG: 3'(2'),5'-bisphosphate nucleotidase CysQ [Cellvibrionaceae bacterium]|nr:3'(2'),5'-bisphosphate nucleotidase CysQ [Cellvibrionaceae bacterium]